MDVEGVFRGQYVDVVAETPRTDWMDWIYKNEPGSIIRYGVDHLCRTIVGRGHICMLEWFEKHMPDDVLGMDVFCIAIRYGRNAAFLDALMGRGYTIHSTEEAWIYAVSMDRRLESLEWLHRRGVPYPDRISVHTTSELTLMWLYEHGIPLDWSHVMVAGTRFNGRGSLRLMQLAHYRGGERITHDICMVVAGARNLETLQWIYSVAPQVLLSTPRRLDGIMLENYTYHLVYVEDAIANDDDLRKHYEVDFRIFEWMESVGVALSGRTHYLMGIYNQNKK